MVDELILDERVVASGPEGAMVWQLVLCDDEDAVPLWVPRRLGVENEVIEEPVWMPLPGSQFAFLQCPVFEACYTGGRGGGKTLTLLMDFAREVGQGHGSAWRGILFRRRYGDLDDVVRKIEDLYPRLFPGFRFLHSKSEYMGVWPTGEALLLRHLKDEHDYPEYHGHEYPWIGFEELTQWENLKAYLKMQSCCRPPQPGVPCRIRSTTNPYGVGHNAVKNRFQLPYMMNKVIRIPGEMDRVATEGILEENFVLLQSTPNYRNIVRQAASNEAEAKAWLSNDWEVTAGGMVDDIWRASTHVIATFDPALIPRSWTITRSYDHGSSSPFSVCWWLESSGEPIELPDGTLIGPIRGDLILFAEWYGTTGGDNEGLRMASRKIGRGIADRETDMGIAGRVIPGPADTQIFNADAERSDKCIADDMEDSGIFWEKADKRPGSRKRGWELLRTRLEDAFPDATGVRERSGLFVCNRCVYFLKLVPSMPRDDVDLDEVPKNYEDHIADACRYRLNWEVSIMWRKDF